MVACLTQIAESFQSHTTMLHYTIPILYYNQCLQHMNDNNSKDQFTGLNTGQNCFNTQSDINLEKVSDTNLYNI